MASSSHQEQTLLRATRHRCAGTVWVVDYDLLERGCGRCAFDVNRARVSNTRRAERLRADADVVQKLRDELNRRRRLPGWVLFSPSADPFVPGAESIRGLALKLMALLMSRGVGVTLRTRGGLRQCRGLVNVARRFPGLLRLEIGLFSAEPKLTESWEAGTAEPTARIALAAEIGAAGGEIVAEVGPIIPFINDADSDIRRTLRALAGAGIQQVRPTFMEDGPGLIQQVEREVSRSRGRLLNGWFRKDDGPRTGVRRLPSDVRRSRHERVVQLARPLGLRVLACRCMMDDAPTAHACTAGPSRNPDQRQLSLFDAASL